MVEAWPSAPLVVPETDFLLELQVVALDPPTHFARSTRARNEIFLLTVASQYFVGSGSPLDHSISSVSSGRPRRPLVGEACTRTRAKRERNALFVPSRHVIVRQACFGRLSANCLTLRRGCRAISSDALRTLSVATIAAT